MDAEILERTLKKIMVCKTCYGSVSIPENRNCHEIGTKDLILRCNNSRCTSETSFHSAHKTELRISNQINTLSALGMKALCSL